MASLFRKIGVNRHMQQGHGNTSKLIILLFIPVLIAAFSGTVSAKQTNADPQMLFNEGNFYFQEHSYHQALQRYHQIEALGLASGPLFLNMALAYHKQDQLGLALFYFRQASAFSDVSAQAREGQEYISERLFQRFGEIPVLNTWTWRYFLFFHAGYAPFVFFSLLLFNICLLGWAAQWFFPKFRTGIRYGVLFAFLGLVPLTAASVWLWSVSERYEAGMIVKEDISLRESPGSQSRVLLEITPGFRFIKNQETSKIHPGFANVELSNGMSGWVPAESARLFIAF